MKSPYFLKLSITCFACDTYLLLFFFFLVVQILNYITYVYNNLILYIFLMYQNRSIIKKIKFYSLIFDCVK
uniref:Uncharacterized protein n=1 Tax=Timema shepardi TaxID=629360 RepID=A0A7R9B3E5_TIMSH|nr:unnamed protein product [Timema shepardi]